MITELVNCGKKKERDRKKRKKTMVLADRQTSKHAG